MDSAVSNFDHLVYNTSPHHTNQKLDGSSTTSGLIRKQTPITNSPILTSAATTSSSNASLTAQSLGLKAHLQHSNMSHFNLVRVDEDSDHLIDNDDPNAYDDDQSTAINTAPYLLLNSELNANSSIMKLTGGHTPGDFMDENSSDNSEASCLMNGQDLMRPDYLFYNNNRISLYSNGQNLIDMNMNSNKTSLDDFEEDFDDAIDLNKPVHHHRQPQLPKLLINSAKNECKFIINGGESGTNVVKSRHQDEDDDDENLLNSVIDQTEIINNTNSNNFIYKLVNGESSNTVTSTSSVLANAGANHHHSVPVSLVLSSGSSSLSSVDSASLSSASSTTSSYSTSSTTHIPPTILSTLSNLSKVYFFNYYTYIIIILVNLINRL